MRRRRGYTRLSTKNQVTIPLDVLDKVSGEPGDEFRVEADPNGTILLIPEKSLGERRRIALRKYAGSLTGVYPPNYLEDLRKEWER